VKTLRIAAISVAVLALACIESASAQQRMYKCVDGKGKVYYTQVPPAECLGKETQELSRQGRVTKKIEGMLTPEQEAAREAERKKQEDAEAAAREEKRKNQALLSTYASEKDVDDARNRALKDNQVQIQDIEKVIASAEKRKKELEGEK
jgi:hypothetical protein